MNRKETRLLVENWRKLLKEDSFSHKELNNENILEESLGKKIALAAALLGSFANINVSNAMPSDEAAKMLNNEFSSAPHFKADGNKVTYKGQTFIKNCDNVSKEELKVAINKKYESGYKEFKTALKKAQEASEEVGSNNSSSKVDEVLNTNENEKKSLIKEFENDFKNNWPELMNLGITSEKILKKNPELKNIENAKYYYIVHIYKY